MTYSGYTVYETIPVDDTTRVVVYYDDDYQMEADERELTPEQIAEEQAILDRDGVYGVTVQKAVKWAQHGPDDMPTGVERVEWEEVDAIWGCFLDDKYTALDVAREHFIL